MSFEEKELEESLWCEFAETGKLPPLPERFMSESAESAAIVVLKGTYNSLTRFLIGELLASRGRLDERLLKCHAGAANWVAEMIHSKKKNYAKQKEMGESFKQQVANSANSQVRAFVQDKMAIQSAWEFLKACKTRYSAVKENSANAIKFVEDLYTLFITPGWKKIKENEELYSGILSWYAFVIAAAEVKDLGGKALAILKKVEPKDLPQSCRKREANPQNVKKPFPATIEKFAAGIFKIFKYELTEKPNRTPITEKQKEWLMWAARFLQDVNAICPGDEWMDYRITKLLLWAGHREEAREYMLIFARHKTSEFWVWELMSEVFPKLAKPCLARALGCKTDEKYTVNVVKKAKELGLPVDDSAELKRLAGPAEALLYEGCPSVNAVYVKSFVQKRDERKPVRRYLFVDENGKTFPPVNETALASRECVNSPGTPVSLYLTEGEADKKILRVKVREAGKCYDGLPILRATCYERTPEGDCRFTADSQEYLLKGKALKTNRVVLGETYPIYYYMRKNKENTECKELVALAGEGVQEVRIRTVQGELRLQKEKGLAFVKNVFVPQSLIKIVQERGVDINEATPVRVEAIQISSKKNNFRGKPEMRERFTAISLELLYGEELEYYLQKRRSNS